MKETAGQIEMWLRNAEANRSILEERAIPWEQLRVPVRLPVTVAGAGFSLTEALYQMDRTFIVANQSSAPYLMYRQVLPSWVVISDGGEAVRERLAYTLEGVWRPQFVVSTFVHPPLLRELVKGGFPVAYFVHGAEDHPEMTQKLVDLAPDKGGEVPCIAQLGSVVNASVALVHGALGPEDHRPLYLGGVDFGYPKWPLLRVADIRKVGRSWVPVAAKDGGIPVTVFGYKTTKQHIEYYNMLRYLVATLPRKMYTLVDGVLNDFMETRRVE